MKVVLEHFYIAVKVNEGFIGLVSQVLLDIVLVEFVHVLFEYLFEAGGVFRFEEIVLAVHFVEELIE